MEAERPTILTVDDMHINRTIIKMCLHGCGHQFLEASNGAQALAQMRPHRVDLVILDLMMPVLDGFGCLAALKADAHCRHIPVIIHSSLDDLESIKRALALGCYDYFIKSLPREELQLILPLKVKNAIQVKRLLDEVCAQKSVLESEIQAAGKYQRFLLPQDFTARGLSIRSSYHPCYGVSGDFFDFLTLSEDKTALLLADVSGHPAEIPLTPAYHGSSCRSRHGPGGLTGPCRYEKGQSYADSHHDSWPDRHPGHLRYDRFFSAQGARSAH